jgi:hypothetical protein
MMVNNFNLIRKFLDFSNPDTYYFLQILKRRKDNPMLEKDMKVIGDYYIYSMEQFNKMESEIIDTCISHNARAYFRLNKRSSKKTAMQMLKRLTDLIVSENYKSVKNVFSSVSGEYHSDKDKKWIVDIDEFDQTKLGQTLKTHAIYQFIEKLQRDTGKEPMMEIIPTKNGVHIITRPFNLQTFKKIYPNINIHKDNPTILFCP